MQPITEEFIRRIPKTDLHVHLDGSLRLSTLIELAKQRKLELPSFSEDGLNQLVFKSHYRDLNEYLSGFQWTVAVMQDPESLERVAYELAIDNAEEGVRYLEVRFAPQLNMHETLGFEEVMHAVDRGLRRARDTLNRDLPAGMPPFEYGIIVCAMRFFTAEFSRYYRELFEVHRYSDPAEVTQYASMEAAKATVKLRRESDVQVVGFDLAGAERGHPAAIHERAFGYVHRGFLNKTVHAGEAYGPESIFQAITKLHADRIGHGLHLFNEELLGIESPEDRRRYVRNLVDFIANNRTTIEVCLTSNLQTSPDIQTPQQHSLGQMLAQNLSLTFCTDNRLVSHTTVTNEILLALQHFDISPRQLKNIIIYGFKRSFFYRPYPEKRRYVRSVINYYESLEREFSIKDR
ncbi:MAG: adenosine deaminase family protein [Spirochaetaceae bacterium]|nr:MAG: adenosine deaminase family protein [Spirochaetaceae bacterium]